MVWAIRGLIEGFYGRPWTWDERIDVMRWCHERAMTHYVYAPKDDPKHRERWREPYDEPELEGFRRLVREGGIDVGFAISPGLSIDAAAEADRRVLLEKVEQVVDLGVDLVCLALDDIPLRAGLGGEHAALTAWLEDALDQRASLILVPTEYTGTDRRTSYLQALADGVPESVPIAWTGRFVVNDSISVEDARDRATSLGGRPPLVWDNYPVNDAVMADRLFLGPLRGREAGLGDVCAGYLANPMVQPRSSKLPLASAAAYLVGEDPEAAWAREAGDLRVLAEACDGEEPRRLVAAAIESGDHASLRAWLDAAAQCSAPGLGDEADPWVEQAHQEARLGLCALDLLAALDGDSPALPRATELALTLAFLWPGIRRAEVSVMGPRCSFRPVLGQSEDGSWVFDRSSLQEDQNAIDHLVRHALDRLSTRSGNEEASRSSG